MTQSNPATLREALAREIADEFCGGSEAVFEAILAKLAASGTEAAPCPECESRKRVHDLFERKWNKDAPETVSVDEIMAAKEGPAQAAASPEGKGRDMPWTPEVEAFRAEMMRRFSNKLSMEEVADFSYWAAQPQRESEQP